MEIKNILIVALIFIIYYVSVIFKNMKWGAKQANELNGNIENSN